MSSHPDFSQGITTFLWVLQGCLHMLKRTLEDREECPSGSKIGAAIFCNASVYLRYIFESLFENLPYSVQMNGKQLSKHIKKL